MGLEGADRTAGMHEKPKRRGAIVWVLLLGTILTIAVFLFTLLLTPGLERGCRSLLEQRDAPVFLPTDCTLTERAPSGDALGRLVAERSKRGLSHQSWIACASPVGAQEWVRAMEADRRWLPSYVPGTYQWRRTIVVLGGRSQVSVEPQVIAEVCVMPRWRYIRQIRGECDGKFAVWK
jgi:hypothetical protein